MAVAMLVATIGAQVVPHCARAGVRTDSGVERTFSAIARGAEQTDRPLARDIAHHDAHERHAGSRGAESRDQDTTGEEASGCALLMSCVTTGPVAARADSPQRFAVVAAAPAFLHRLHSFPSSAQDPPPPRPLV